MKKSSVILLAAVIPFFIGGCRSLTTADNANQINSNSVISVVPNNPANTNQANVKIEETPLPTFTDAQTALDEGKKLLDANQTEKAVEALKQAVKLDPDSAEAFFNLGIAYALLEKETGDQPVGEASPAPSKKSKKDAVAPLTRSEKAFDSAAKAYEKITGKNPKDDNAFFNLGRAYNKLNKDEEAEKALRQAVKLKSDDAEYQTELGAILIKLAKYDDAVTILKKSLELDPENSHAQDLLDKADAGQKRINYGTKPKTAENVSKPRSGKNGSTNDSGDAEQVLPSGRTVPKPVAPPPASTAKPSVDKKGNVH